MAWRHGLGWYARRLAVMGPRELAHRAVEQGQLAALRLRQADGGDRGAPVAIQASVFCTAAARQLPDLAWDLAPLEAAVGDLLQGHAPALGFDWQWVPAPEAWHRAPDTGRTWPRGFFASIPYRAGNPYGDARVVWEPSRLQWLLALALLAEGGDDPQRQAAVRLVETALLSWVAANPPYRGVHYVSAMECALRLIAVCHALDLLRSRLERPQDTWPALLRLVVSHATLIEKRLSLYSSAGNHTVAECAGLIYAGTLFPEQPHAARWRRTGLALLAREAGRQVLEDGGGVEQAFAYLLFVSDLCGLVTALLRHRGEEPPHAVASACERGRQFLGALAGTPGQLPAVGDGDDGFALSPALRLSLDGGERRVAAGLRTFPAAGYSLLGGSGSAAPEVLFDHGPLGMPPSYAHGHADALAVLVRSAGVDVLVDPGTYTYTGHAGWRRYFRSTAAHNTVRVDGHDQAVQETAFMWSAPYHCELCRAEAGDGVLRVLARHDGYRRLGGVVHWRGLVLREPDELLVWDRLEGTGSHALELNWHAAVAVRAAGARFLLGETHALEVAGAQALMCLTAAKDPDGGWRATRYGRKEPITTIRASHAGRLPHEFVTRIYPQHKNAMQGMTEADLEVFRRWCQ